MYKPLTDQEMHLIHQTALDVLENIGMADPPQFVSEMALNSGCTLNNKGRLCFPRSFIKEVIASTDRDSVLPARDAANDLDISKGIFPGMCGVATNVIDFETGQYQPSTIIDNYDFIRLADRLDNICIVNDCVSDENITDSFEDDINKTYALLAGTSKPCFLHLDNAANLDAVISLVDTVLGGEGRFCERPFMSMSVGPFKSPMIFSSVACEKLFASVRKGIPLHIAIVPSAGATSPTALAGTLVQMLVEAFASLALVHLISPGHKLQLVMCPFVIDLRNGLTLGGAPELALLGAASAQLVRSYGLPCALCIGASDSKLPDYQNGFEKAITVLLSGLAGGNSPQYGAGSHAALMGMSFESMVLDDDAFGALRRIERGIEVTEETLSYKAIEEVMDGDRHFFSHPQTVSLMRSEYYYPKLADRDSITEWVKKGSLDSRARARKRVTEILSTHYPPYIDPGVDEEIRKRFPIRMPREMMRADTGRW